MFRTVYWFAYFWFRVLMTVPALFSAISLQKQGNSRGASSVANGQAVSWSRALLSASGSTVQVEGMENIPNDTAVLFVSNHQGNFDIPILLGFIDKPKGFIAKMELEKLPVISIWMNYMKCVFMDRDDVRQSLRAINKGAEYLKEGYSLVVFPEGTRSKGPVPGEFKAGSFKLAVKAGVPIVPVTINGSYKIMEQQGIWIRPAVVEVKIAPPIYAEDYRGKDIKEVAAEVSDVITANFKSN